MRYHANAKVSAIIPILLLAMLTLQCNHVGDPLAMRTRNQPTADDQVSSAHVSAPSLCPAVKKGDLALVNKLLNERVDVNYSSERWKASPLHLAAESGYTQIAQALLEAGADIKARDRAYQCTPLHFAADKGHLDILSLLIAYGADVTAQDWLKRTPLHFVARGSDKLSDRLKIIEKLLEAGAAINQRDRDDGHRTPLDWASQEKIKELLLKNGAKSGKEMGWCTIQ